MTQHPDEESNKSAFYEHSGSNPQPLTLNPTLNLKSQSPLLQNLGCATMGIIGMKPIGMPIGLRLEGILKMFSV